MAVMNQSTALRSETKATGLWSTLGGSLLPYVTLASHLHSACYTPKEITDELGRITPPIASNLTSAPPPEQLTDEMCHLRLLEPLGDGRYRRWSYLMDGTKDSLLRYVALTMLVPLGDGTKILPILTAPMDGLPHPVSAWPLGEALIRWYEEANLIEHVGDGMWRAKKDALESLWSTTSTDTEINIFLGNLKKVRQNEFDDDAPDDTSLEWLSLERLDERIREIQRELLIDRKTIIRIYCALISGHHVILSGPPGTGKTHLARILPRILWRDANNITIRRMLTDPNVSPKDSLIEERRVRYGYDVDVVTATEDWGIRHVIGGIAPRIEQTSNGRELIYIIDHGCLTRAVLSNYVGYDGETIPNMPFLRRGTVKDRQGNYYRGHWLVIDEFTRAPVDAALGGLLTTLGSQGNPLMVPSDRGDVAVPLPRDFRILGTLNSFDRHFLNQISEALKRRFVFIDILPPSQEQSKAEQAIAIYRALRSLYNNGMPDISIDEEELGSLVIWENRITVDCNIDYVIESANQQIETIITDAWRFFRVIRVYRQLGTAQAEALYSNLFTGMSVGMEWAEAIDAAFADTLADQLQILSRDEQQVLLAFLEHPADETQFTNKVREILSQMPGPRQVAHLSLLKESAHPATESINPKRLESLKAKHLTTLFPLGAPLSLRSDGVFARRLRSFIHERGL